MPPAKKPSGPKPVVATTHDDKRTNIPTADAQEWVAPEMEAPVKVRWPRDHSLDPQLVWKGKDEEADVLEGDAPPLYIQEKIDPRVLVENLRRTAKAGEVEPELTLFDSFDGLDELENLEFYEHDANWSNRMILGDSLNVMASLAERERLRGKVQMVYLDPPYGIKFGSNWQVSARKRDVKDGKVEDASRQVEQIKAFRDTWELGINSYLTYLRDRLLAARDLLTESGSCFVQIGDENVHLVRSLMDEVFGSENFVSLITVKKTSAVGSFGGGTNLLPSTCDYVIWYARDTAVAKYRPAFKNKDTGGAGGSDYRWIELADGSRRTASAGEMSSGVADGRFFRPGPITSITVREARTTVFPVELDGRSFLPGGGRGWSTNRAGMQRLGWAGRLVAQGKSLAFLRYLDDFPAFPLTDLWDDTQSGSAMEKVYVVQTNVKIIQRCLLMCSDPGDLVLDPTCGSGSTAFVAEQWGRRWITVDTSRVALALARQRLMGARFPYYLLADSPDGRLKEGQLTGTPLPNASTTHDIRQGFVYDRIPHITLKAIAHNPDIIEGMSRAEIDAAIKRHADFELLYDKPYEDKGKVRVTGPFTVESLSPHRSIAFAGGPDQGTHDPRAASEAVDDTAGADFQQTILDNLLKAGIQNGRREERIELEMIEPYAGTNIHAIGTQKVAGGATPVRVGISLGPQYGTVNGKFVRDAALEARDAGGTDDAESRIDLLCVLAFAFDANVVGTTVEGAEVKADLDDDFASVAAERKLGRVPVLLVRMNADLVMGEELKKTGAGNLFTVFGEPDIEITEDGDTITVELLGVDVYDPTTGEVRSRDTDRIALWMIDSDYDGDSFFVRHAYFTGGQDPYKKLKRDLKAEIDEDAWASLYRTVSRPFPKPSTGRIAVKVINDYGDEVLQVFDV